MDTKNISAKIKAAISGNNAIQAAGGINVRIQDSSFESAMSSLSNPRFVIQLIAQADMGTVQLKSGNFLKGDPSIQFNNRTGLIDVYQNIQYYNDMEGEWDVAGAIFSYDIKRGKFVTVDFGGGAW